MDSTKGDRFINMQIRGFGYGCVIVGVILTILGAVFTFVLGPLLSFSEWILGFPLWTFIAIGVILIIVGVIIRIIAPKRKS